MKTALTIAGSDSSGGAGIQADIKTMMANGVYAMSAVTALTAQNTAGVAGIMEAEPEFLGQQLDCVFTDIRPDAVKIGMVSSPGLIAVIADKLIQYKKVSNDLFYSNIEKLLEDINNEENKDITLILFLINIINEANQRKILAEKIIDLYFKK